MEEGEGHPLTEAYFAGLAAETRLVIGFVEKGRTGPSWFRILDRLYRDKAEAYNEAEHLAERHPEHLVVVIPVGVKPLFEHVVRPGHMAQRLKDEEEARRRAQAAMDEKAGA